MQGRLNAKYEEMCKELGNLTAQIFLLQQRQQDILADIKALDSLTPMIVKLAREAQIVEQAQKTEKGSEA